MQTPLDLDALKARLSEYDDTLPRCLKKVARKSNFAPDPLTSKDEAYHDYDFTTHSPCIRPEGHADECRNSRFILGWPGYDTLRSLIAEVENLRAHREAVAAWLWQQSVATNDYEGNEQTVSEVYASAARAIERGEHHREED
jgi:hypothetical protein